MTTNTPQDRPKDEFYVNYLPMPRSWSAFLLKFVPLLIAGVLIFAYILPTVHDQYNKGGYTKRAEYLGYLATSPVPHLIVPRPGNTAAGADYSYYPLAAGNKAGPPKKVMAQAGNWVKLTGLPIARNHFTLLAAFKAEKAEAPEGFELDLKGKSLGEFTVEGEIVDPKCYSGVMKPGRTKTHRGCAIRCISGGIPPTLVSHNAQGDTIYFVLSDLEDQAVNDQVLNVVGDPLRITGEVVQFGDTFVLKADPETYEVI